MQALVCMGQRTAPIIIKLVGLVLIVLVSVSSIIFAIVRFVPFDIFPRPL